MIYHIFRNSISEEEKMVDSISNLTTEYKTKNNLVFNLLKEKILSGETKPKEKLIIRNIASSLNLSETPVREALKMLQTECLVSSIPHVGFAVTEINLKELQDILTIRLNLECLATELAADNISNEDIRKLTENTQEMNESIKANDIANYGCLNRKFHQIIYAAAGNQILLKHIIDLWDRSGRARSIFIFLPEITKSSYKEHRQIVDLLKKKDKENVVKIMTQHKKRAFSALLDYIKNHDK